MKKFTVTVDVVMSGDIEIEASTKKEAKEKAKNRYFYSNDLSHFHQIKTSVVEVV